MLQGRRSDPVVMDPKSTSQIPVSGGIKLLLFFVQTTYLLSSSYYLPSSNTHQALSNFNYKITGKIEEQLCADRDRA